MPRWRVLGQFCQIQSRGLRLCLHSDRGQTVIPNLSPTHHQAEWQSHLKSLPVLSTVWRCTWHSNPAQGLDMVDCARGQSMQIWHSNELPRGHILYRQKYCKNCTEEILFVSTTIHQYSEKSQLTELSTCSRVGDALDIDHIPLGFDVGIVQMDNRQAHVPCWPIPMICHIILYHQNILISRVHCSNGQRSNISTLEITLWKVL